MELVIELIMKIKLFYVFVLVFLCNGCNKEGEIVSELRKIKNAILLVDKYAYIKSERTFSFHDSKGFLKRVEVNLEHNFLFKSTEVSNYNWEVIMGEKVEGQCGWLCAKTMNSFLDAVRIANKMSEREGLELCYVITEERIQWIHGYACTGYRVPTMAEWWTALGDYPFEVYDNDETQYLVADLHVKYQPLIASKKPNKYGIYDMHGGLREYLWDGYENHLTGLYYIDLEKNISKDYVIVKDCDWYSERRKCSFYMNRASFELNVKFAPNGIRLVRTVK